MADMTIREYVDASIGAPGMERAQKKSAGAIIAQFLLVREGLMGRIPDEDLNATAATLTAGIWANND